MTALAPEPFTPLVETYRPVVVVETNWKLVWILVEDDDQDTDDVVAMVNDNLPDYGKDIDAAPVLESDWEARRPTSTDLASARYWDAQFAGPPDRCSHCGLEGDFGQPLRPGEHARECPSFDPIWPF